MSRSTTHRYAATLLALGYLEQDAARKYRLGARAAELGLRALAVGAAVFPPVGDDADPGRSPRAMAWRPGSASADPATA